MKEVVYSKWKCARVYCKAAEVLMILPAIRYLTISDLSELPQSNKCPFLPN